MIPPSSSSIGRRGEDAAARWLELHGFQILERNWHFSRYGEIDMIVRNDAYLVFVEIKSTRSGATDPLSAVDDRKRIQLLRLAEAYLKQHSELQHLQPRIDVIAVFLATEPPQLHHLPNAVIHEPL